MKPIHTKLRLIAIFLCLLSTGRAAAAENIVISLESTSLVLGESRGMKVEIPLPEGATRVFVQALYGSIVSRNNTTTGTWIADYTPPEQFFPAVDYIVAAVDRGEEQLWGIAAVELIGQGEVKMKTRPFAPAQVRIGDQTYGPVKANGKGQVTIRVKVPPGVTRGQDELGAMVDLQVPPLPRAAVFARWGNTVDSASSEPSPLLILMFNEEGRIAEGETPQVTASAGSVQTLHKENAGVYSAAYSPSSDGDATSDTISVANAADPLHPFELAIALEKNSQATRETGAAAAKPEAVSTEPSGDAPKDSSRIFISLKGGIAWNAGSLLCGGGELDFGVRPFHEKVPLLGFGVAAAFLHSSEETDSGDQINRASTNLLPILATVFVRVPMGRRLALVPDVQLGMSWVQNRIIQEASGETVVNAVESNVLFTLGARLTLEILAWKGAVLLHAGGRLVLGELETLDGKLSTLDFMAGYRLYLL